METLVLVFIGLANLFLCLGGFIYQTRFNNDTMHAIDRLNRRLRDLEVKAGWRG